MAEKRLAGTRVLLVIAPEQYRDEEFEVPKRVLSENGAQVQVASTSKKEATGMLGGKAAPDLLVSEAKEPDYNAVIVVGGMGSPEFLWNDAHLHKLVQESYKNGKVVASICLSGAVLANAGVLAGKRATVWKMPESLQALEQGRAIYVEQPVVQDGKLITANGPEAAEEFASTIAAELSRVKV